MGNTAYSTNLPHLLTTEGVMVEKKVTRDCVNKWKAQGHLTPVSVLINPGKRGQIATYLYGQADVIKFTPPRPRARLRAKKRTRRGTPSLNAAILKVLDQRLETAVSQALEKLTAPSAEPRRLDPSQT